MYDNAGFKRKSGLVKYSVFFLLYIVLLSTAIGNNVDQYFNKLISLSPHPPGSANHEKTKSYIINVLRKNNAKVKLQKFIYKNPFIGKTEGINIIASYKGRSEEEILFVSHWDTRPVADKEKKESLKKRPIIGANDGNSSTAVLLALSDYLKKIENPEFTVVLVFFDAEDSGTNSKNYCIGSQYFVDEYNLDNIRYGILIDMIGDKNLEIPKEGFSYLYSKKTTESVWQLAKEYFGYAFFKDKIGRFIVDDHYPFLKKGVPFVNIIDFQYQHWHKLSDIKENCSIKNMEKILKLLKHIANNPKKIYVDQN